MASTDAATSLPVRAKEQGNEIHTLVIPVRPSNIAIAVDPVAFITTECITVTSAMRKHVRWAPSSVSAILGGSTIDSKQSRKYLAPKSARPTQRKDAVAATNGAAEEEEEPPLPRWGLRPDRTKTAKPNPLMSAFARLRGDLKGCRDIYSFDVPALLHPFLQVIRSSSTSASITGFALIAITKFFSYRIIGPQSPRLPHAMQLLSAAITHCRFEASDTTADEYVLQLILELMENMLSGPGGDLLSDESICEMMETGLSMCCQARLSEQLRRLAERKMVAMCQIIFERLKTLEAVEDTDGGKLGFKDTQKQETDLHMEAPLQGSNTVLQARSAPLSTVVSDSETLREPSMDGRFSLETQTLKSDAASRISQDQSGVSEKTDAADEPAKIAPYGVPSIRELFRVLVNLLEPGDKQHTDAMRVMALRVIDVAIEVAGAAIVQHPGLASLARDDLCRNLFQLVRTENMAMLNESLRVATTLLSTCRPVLKLQQELYLSYLVACLHPKIGVPHEDGIDPSIYQGVPQAPKLVKPPAGGSGRATPVPVKDRRNLGLEGGNRRPEARESMVENLGALARIPTFMVELFVNYDCAADRVDLCEDLIALLARSAFPDAANWSTKNVPPLCLDSLLSYVQFIAERLDDNTENSLMGAQRTEQSIGRLDDERLPTPEALREQRRQKKIIITGAQKFNEKPKDGIAFLASQGIIKDPSNPVAVAQFLRGTSRVSKAVLGEFISKKGNEELLKAFIATFKFEGQRVDEAFRDMLGTFRLPGESALIERIATAFAEKYSETAPVEDVANSDAVYILVYAVIMLNTDQHNRNTKATPMTREAFVKNLRGVNDGKDFNPEYLHSIFESIRTNEIILPEEHNNKDAFDYAWKELLLKTNDTGSFIECNTNRYDADMFDATWKPVLAALSYVFMSATEDAVFERVILGFEQCAEIAAKYNLTHILDHIVFCLSTISSLSVETLPSTALNTEVSVRKRKVMVSEMAVKFGRHPKAQLAAIVLFKGVVAGNEGKLSDGWTHLVKIWLNLFVNSQLPALPESARIAPDMPALPVRTPTKIIDKDQQAQNAGLFSSFTSLISSYAADEPPEPSDEEVLDTIKAIDCLAECSFEDMFNRIISLPTESLTSLVHALLEQLPQDNTPVVAVVKPEAINPANPRSNAQRAQSQTSYSPAIAYVLELASTLIIRNPSALETVGKEVVEALRDNLRSAGSSHPLLVSRTIFYLLHILSVSHVSILVVSHYSLSNHQQDQTFVRAPVILHSIDGLGNQMLEQCALPILKGLEQCLRGSKPLRNEIVNTPDFWSILRRVGQIPDVANEAFEILKSITADSFSAVTADNYELVVLALNDFASRGSAGASLEQNRDKARRMNKSVKPLDVKGNEFVARAIQAIAITYKLSGRAPSLIEKSNLAKGEAWANYWTPIFKSLSTQCGNPCREVRHQAFGGLQRVLLSPDVAANDEAAWRLIFDETLFPLILTLLKPEVYHSDPYGMPETRVQAANLLCKVFLNFLNLLAQWPGMEELWLRIMDVMDRLMNSGQPADAQVEALHESLKNTLLVMASGEYLTDEPADAASTKLWSLTKKKLDRFQPEMVREIFPERPKAVETAPVEAKTPVQEEQGKADEGEADKAAA